MRRALAVAGIATVLLTAGCAQGGETGAATPQRSDTIQVDESLRQRLPEAIRNGGAIQFATDPSYAPMESYGSDGRTVIGFDADLAAALGAILGIKIEMVPADFSTALDDTAAGTYDGVLSAVTDTVEREKKVDFVNYFSAGTSIVVRRGNPSGVSDLKDLCGKAVAVEKGTVQLDLLQRSQKGCAGKPIDIRQFKTNNDALLQVRTGRAVAILNDFPPAVQLTSDPASRTHYQLASTVQYEPGLYGIAVSKANPELRDALHLALDQLIRNGVYGELLTRWGLTTGALQATSINAAGGGIGE